MTRGAILGRVLGWSLVAVAAICALATVLVIGVREGAARDTIRRAVEQFASEAIGGELRIGAIEGRLLPDLVLRDVELFADPGHDQPLLRAGEIVARVDLDPALRGEPIAIRSLTLARVELRVWRDSGGASGDEPGEWNFASLGDDSIDPEATPVEDPTSETGATALVIDRLRIVAASIELRDGSRISQAALEAELERIALPPTAEGAAALSGQIQLTPEGQELAELTVRDGVASLAEYHARFAEGAGGSVTLEGKAEFAPWLDPDGLATAALTIAVAQLDPAQLPIAELPTGQLSGRAELAIERREGVLHGSFGVSLDAGRIDDFDFTRAAASGSLRNSDFAWTFDEFSLEAPTLRAAVHGRGTADRAEQLAVSLDIDDLGTLASSFDVPVDGRLTLEAAISGTLEAPRGSWTARGEALSWDTPANRRLEIDTATVRGSALGKAPKWQLDELSLIGPALRLEARGRGLGPGVEELEAALDVSDLAAIAALVDWPLAGRLTVDASLSGTLDVPQGGWTARGEALTWEDRSIGRLDLTARMASRQRITIEHFELSDGELPIRLAEAAELDLTGGGVTTPGLELRSSELGSVRWSGGVRDGEFHDAALAVDGLDPAAVARMTGREFAPGGRAELEFALTGPVARPNTTGEFNWEAPSLETLQLASLRGELSTGDGALTLALSGFDGRASGPAFRIDAQAPWHPEVALDSLDRNPATRLHLTARELTVERVAYLLPSALRDAAGVVTLDLTLEGSAEGAQLGGQLEFSGGSLEVPLVRQRLEPIEARIQLVGDRIEIERLTIGPDGEQARLTGSVAIAELRPVRADLKADLDRFRLKGTSLARARASGGVTVTGPVDALVVEGGLVLDELRVTLPDERDRELREIQVFAASVGDDDASEFVEVEAEPDSFDRASLDIGLQIKPGSRVHGRGIEISLKGNLQLDKRPLDPVRLTGTAEVDRGHIEFQRKRFDVRKGIVQFDGSPDPSDPVVDILAAHRVRDVTVILLARGRLSDPNLIQLDGEPSMTPDEALAYLIFGRPVDELGNSEQGSVQSAAASLAASVAFDEFSRIITDAGVVDTIDVDITEDGSIGALRVGTYIGNDTFVRAGNTFGAENEQDVHVEYRLTPYLSVESELSTTGNAGADLILRLDY